MVVMAATEGLAGAGSGWATEGHAKDTITHHRRMSRVTTELRLTGTWVGSATEATASPTREEPLGRAADDVLQQRREAALRYGEASVLLMLRGVKLRTTFAWLNASMDRRRCVPC